MGRPTIEAIFFDVGETLASETRMWEQAGHSLGLSSVEIFDALNASIEARESVSALFDKFGTSLDKAVDLSEFSTEDLYPDAAPALEALKGVGYFVGIAANQPLVREPIIRGWDLAVDVVVTSEGLGIRKPDPKFFDKLADLASVSPERIAYVGDRVDNDVLPTVAAGMVAVFLRRGPWAAVQKDWPEASQAHITIDGLSELPDALAAL